MTSNYSIINRRFDFAVPLEDIFTNGGIHPRLKFIFQQAYELYLGSHLNLKQTLQEDYCLSKCLELKQRIVYAKQPAIHSQHLPPGAFFWIIRHFLGLLPISLLPTITSDQKFPWKELSRKCSRCLRYKLTEGECELNHSIARILNNLPQEHILLLNTLVIFIRDISKKRFCKANLKNLAQYYCDAVFVRPFQPGHTIKGETMLPLFIYIITRWNRISKYLSIHNLNSCHYKNSDIVVVDIVNSSTQTSRFISDFRDAPCKIVKYLKEVECQTDINDEDEINVDQIDSLTTKQLAPNDVDKSIHLVDNEDISLNTFTAHLNKRKAPSFVSSFVNINEQEENIECEKCQRIDFLDNTVNDRDKNWKDVIQEIARTVKRVEAQNYETGDKHFKSDNYFSTDTSEPSESTFESGTLDTFKDSNLNGNKTEDSQNTVSFKSIKDVSKVTVNTSTRKNDQNISLYKSFYESDEELYNMNGEKSIYFEEDVEHNLSNFSLKRFKIKFNFLRTLSPKFKGSKRFRYILARNIKYEKIKN